MFGLEVGTDLVSTFKGAACCTNCGYEEFQLLLKMHRGTRCLQKVEVCQLVERWVCQKESLQQCPGVAEGHVVGVWLLSS
jgi:hypothetical protein